MAYLKNILILLSLLCHESLSSDLSNELEGQNRTTDLTFQRKISLKAGILSDLEITFPDLNCDADKYGDDKCNIPYRSEERVHFSQTFKASSKALVLKLGLQLSVGNSPQRLILDLTEEFPVCGGGAELKIPDIWYDTLSFLPGFPDPKLIESIIPSWLCVTGGAEVKFELEWRLPLPKRNPLLDLNIGLMYGFKNATGFEDTVTIDLLFRRNSTPALETNPSVHDFKRL